MVEATRTLKRVVSDAELVYARYPGEYISLVKNAMISEFGEVPEGTYEYKDEDGNHVIVMFAPKGTENNE